MSEANFADLAVPMDDVVEGNRLTPEQQHWLKTHMTQEDTKEVMQPLVTMFYKCKATGMFLGGVVGKFSSVPRYNVFFVFQRNNLLIVHTFSRRRQLVPPRPGCAGPPQRLQVLLQLLRFQLRLRLRPSMGPSVLSPAAH